MKTLKKGTTNKGTTILLQSLLREAGYNISADGSFGVGTETAVMDYQRKNGLVADGVVGNKTWMRFASQFPELFERLANRFLSEEDVEAAARDLGVEVATVKAVTEVESQGTGFLGDKPRILFEGHVFWKQLKDAGLDPQKFRAGNEDILYPSWTKTHYLGGLREYERLEKAKKIHEAAALSSASWGMFQIMGYHWKSLGYASVADFVGRMEKSEGEHLNGFTRFLKANNLVNALKNRQWAAFARAYNGPGFKENKYDEKLEKAYQRYAT